MVWEWESESGSIQNAGSRIWEKFDVLFLLLWLRQYAVKKKNKVLNVLGPDPKNDNSGDTDPFRTYQLMSVYAWMCMCECACSVLADVMRVLNENSLKFRANL